MEQVQYISDANANITGVIVPIKKIWRELQSERETAYLLKSEAMRERLLTARQRNKGKVRPKFGSAAGRIEMSDDFDEPLEEFEEYMP